MAKRLEEKHIRNKSYFFPSRHPVDNCVAQHPCPLAPLKENKVITYVSQGNKKPVILPDFKHKKATDVIEFLKKYENTINVEIIHSPRCKKDHICDEHCIVSDQKPLAGSIIHLDKEKKLSIYLKVEREQKKKQSF